MRRRFCRPIRSTSRGSSLSGRPLTRHNIEFRAASFIGHPWMRCVGAVRNASAINFQPTSGFFMAVIRHHVGKRLSETAVYNGTVYLAGQIAEDADQDITGQTREVLGHIDRLLEEVNSDKSHLLSVQIYISDMVHFAGMNAGWAGW